ncbi:MAG: hypothetical protein JNK12_14045 [Acidimicrobiales bacterium]|nr:hypothetical protein [Acidimicrobiales bacterium]
MDIELPSDAGERLPGFVELSGHPDIVGSEHTASATTTLDAMPLQMTGHGGAVDLEGSRQQLGGLAGLVAPQQVSHLVGRQATLHLLDTSSAGPLDLGLGVLWRSFHRREGSDPLGSRTARLGPLIELSRTDTLGRNAGLRSGTPSWPAASGPPPSPLDRGLRLAPDVIVVGLQAKS